MRRFPSSPRHRPIARNPVIGAGEDDLSTWTSTSQISTIALPGLATTLYPLVVDVTKIISSAAAADVNGLRFVHANGVRFAHKRTPGGRILLIGDFTGGRNTFNYYWTKIGATQPGGGFPTADAALAGYRVGLLFDNSAPLDIAPSQAPWTIVGSPTYETYSLGQAMKFGNGSYIETTAAKLRADARQQRAMFASITLPNSNEARIITWANWPIDQRAFQLWLRTDGLELYTSDTGTSYQSRLLLRFQRVGPNSIGCSWKAGRAEALMMCNEAVESVLPSGGGAPTGDLFNANTPVVVGGTKVAGFFFEGTLRCWFELHGEFKSAEHLTIWKMAWDENDAFWGFLDRTPDNFDVPDVSGAPLSSEVAFARKQITGIAAGTSVSVHGPGNPTYSLGSSFTAIADVKAKGSTPGTVNPGHWLASYHTSEAVYQTVQESGVTVGTVTSLRRSTTAAAPVGGGGTPGGPATVTVTSVSALAAAFKAAKHGDIIEIGPGDYRSQGKLYLTNMDFRGGTRVEVRSATLPYRGYLPSEGGLLVPGETGFVSGSGGSEFSGLVLSNVHNVSIRGFRFRQGAVGTAGAKWYTADCTSSSNITFENCIFTGHKPTTDMRLWGADAYRPTNGWYDQGGGVQIGVGGVCSYMSFKKCVFQWFGGGIALYLGAAYPNSLVEDCVFTDQKSDHIRNDGKQEGFIARRCIFYRTWPQKGSTGNVDHSDHIQNTTKTQSGWINHTVDSCIFAPGNCIYPHTQGVFYEHDLPLDYPLGYGLYVQNSLFESRVVNTIFSLPADRTHIKNVTILQNQYGGLNIMNAAGTDSLLDTTFNTPQIRTSSTSAASYSKGTSTVTDTIYMAHSLDLARGDELITSTALSPSQYATELFNYGQYSGPIRQSNPFVPALPLVTASAWKQPQLLNSSLVLVPDELKKMAPKFSSSLHPDKKGRHYGCSKLFQDLGALPLS